MVSGSGCSVHIRVTNYVEVTSEEKSSFSDLCYLHVQFFAESQLLLVWTIYVDQCVGDLVNVAYED